MTVPPSAPQDVRPAIRIALSRLLADPAAATASDSPLAPGACFHLAGPAAACEGAAAIEAGWLAPLRRALAGAHRRDILLIGGDNARQTGGHWVAAITHYVGTFAAPLFGLTPSHRLAFLRSGEFYRTEGGRITEGRIIFDLPDLMRQAGRFPLPRDQGTEMAFPAPATLDGICPEAPALTPHSMAVVEAMMQGLHAYDPATFGSQGQTGEGGIWAKDMLWYGPGGVGATFRWEGFVKDHRASFLRAFPDRQGGNHYCRISDGAYMAMSGWPSMTMTHRGPYLGSPATGRALTLNVMDFYRCTGFDPARLGEDGTAGGQIAENWVCLDYIDLARQMGRDLVAEANALPPPG